MKSSGHQEIFKRNGTKQNIVTEMPFTLADPSPHLPTHTDGPRQES